jgi:uncharacterized protein YcbX
MTAGRVVALYRYPIKGLTPERCESLNVLDTGRIAGDRVLGFRFADTPEADDAWSSKRGMLVLMNTPGLARLRVTYDDAAERISIRDETGVLADEPLDNAGRARLCEAMAGFALRLDENPLVGHPERLPLRLVGDGKTPRLHDSPDGHVTLHGRGSLESLRKAIGDPSLSELRFRSNIAVDGIDPWAEQEWEGVVRIGDARFEVNRPKVRCLATHANPETGERDRAVLTTLTSAFSQEQPTFAISMVPVGAALVRLGDEVQIMNQAG